MRGRSAPWVSPSPTGRISGDPTRPPSGDFLPVFAEEDGETSKFPFAADQQVQQAGPSGLAEAVRIASGSVYTLPS